MNILTPPRPQNLRDIYLNSHDTHSDGMLSPGNTIGENASWQDPGGFVYCSKKARAKQKAAGSSNSPVPHGSDLTFKYETTRQKKKHQP